MDLYEAWEEMTSKNILLEYKVGPEFSELSDSDKTLLMKTMNKFYDSNKYNDDRKTDARKLVKQNLQTIYAKLKNTEAKTKIQGVLSKLGDIPGEEPKKDVPIVEMPKEMKKDIDVKTDVTPKEVTEEVSADEINFVQKLINLGLKENNFFSFGSKSEPKSFYLPNSGAKLLAHTISLNDLKMDKKVLADVIRKLYRKEYLDSTIEEIKYDSWKDSPSSQVMFYFISPALIKLLRSQGIDTTEKKGHFYITNYMYIDYDLEERFDNKELNDLYKKSDELYKIMSKYRKFSSKKENNYVDDFTSKFNKEWKFDMGPNSYNKVTGKAFLFMTSGIPSNTLKEFIAELTNAGAKISKEFISKNSRNEIECKFASIQGTTVYNYIKGLKNPKFVDQIQKDIDKKLKSHKLSEKELATRYAIEYYHYDSHYMDYGETDFIQMTGKELVSRLGLIDAYNLIKGKVGSDNNGNNTITVYGRAQERYSIASKYHVPKEIQQRWKKWGYKVKFA